MSEDETECRLTFAEGRRIRREAEKPYWLKTTLCMLAAFAFLAGMSLYADIEYDVLWEGIKGIENRILAGDFQAIVDYHHYNSLMDTGVIFSIIFILFAMGYAILGHLAGKKALKEANEGKAERCRGTEGPNPSRRYGSATRGSPRRTR